MSITIITHAGRPHMDDILGVALLVRFFTSYNNEAHVMRIPHKEVDAYRHIENAVWVDLGGEYSEINRKFDHHHDSDLRCSMSLVRQHINTIIGNEYGMETKIEAYLDYLDRHGPVAANALGICTKDEIATIYELTTIITRIIDVYWDNMCDTGISYWDTPYTSVAKSIEKYKGCITINCLKHIVNMLSYKYPDSAKLAIENINVEKRLVSVDLDNAAIIDTDTDWVLKAIDPEIDNSAKFELEEAHTDFLLRKSSRDSSTTYLLANTQRGRSVKDLEHFIPSEDIQFIHNNGFLMVINKPLTDDVLMWFMPV